jgi:hypothetical protein
MDINLPEALRELYEEDSSAKTLFDWACTRQNDASYTSIERLVQKAGVERRKAVELARRLEELGYARFIAGRRGKPSRIEWKPSLKSVGRAAMGQTAMVEPVAPELRITPPERFGPTAEEAESVVAPTENLSIAEAKRRLAASLGVAPEAIEITVRA